MPLAELQDGRLGFEFPLSARRAWRAPTYTRPSEWAEGVGRHVPQSSRPGPWRNENAPYLAGVMDAWAFPSVRELVYVAPPQCGKSEAAMCALGFVADQDPAPAMYVMQSDDDAKEMSRDRIIPMFEETPALAALLSPAAKDTSTIRIALQHMPLYLAWGTSVSKLASKPIKYLFLDEEEKYPVFKRETDPVRLAKKRTRTFPTRKIMRTSTPTTEKGSIWQALQSCPVKFKYFVRCPDCGRLQVMDFHQVRVPEDERDPEHIKRELLAWYVCSFCGSCWDDAARDRAVAHGRWMTEDERDMEAVLRSERPHRVGFHHSALISSFVSLSEVMGAWFEAQHSKTALRDFMNGYLAEPWVDYLVERNEDRILDLRDDRQRGLVPGGGRVACLLATVDTQARDFRFEVRAWGWGLTRESWMVREGPVDSWAGLAQVLWEDEYKDAEGNVWPVRFTLIDAMGDKTADVYEFCRMHRGRIAPLKGEQTMAQPYRWTVVEFWPGTNKPIPGGLKLLRVNTTHYKDELTGKLEISATDPGAWHLHSEVSRAWAREMTVEYKNDKGVWVCPEGRANEAWDLAAYQLCLADMMQVRFWKQKAAAAPKAPPRRPEENPYTKGHNPFGGMR